MCAPIAIPIALAVASSALQIKSQNDAAKAQNANILESTKDNYSALNRQAIEDRENTSIQVDQINRETQKRVSTAETSAAGNGIGGLSVDALLLDLSGKGLEAQTSAETNYLRSQQAREDQMTGVYHGGRSQASQVHNVGNADYLAAGLKIASAAYGAYNGASVSPPVRGSN